MIYQQQTAEADVVALMVTTLPAGSSSSCYFAAEVDAAVVADSASEAIPAVAASSGFC